MRFRQHFLSLHFSVAYPSYICLALHKIYDLIQAPLAFLIGLEQFLPVGFRLLLQEFLIQVLRFFQFLSQLQYLLFLPFQPDPDIQCFPAAFRVLLLPSSRLLPSG